MSEVRRIPHGTGGTPPPGESPVSTHSPSVHAALGENEEAFTWLENAYRNRDANLASVRVDAAVDGLRQDPRFQQLLARIDRH